MEPTWAIQQPQISKITAAGGAVIAMVKSTAMGSNTGDNVSCLPATDEARATSRKQAFARRANTSRECVANTSAARSWLARIRVMLAEHHERR